MGRDDLVWKDASGKASTLPGRTYGMGEASNTEKQKAKNYFKNNGFSANNVNTTGGISAATKGKFVCLYQENIDLNDFKFTCGIVE